MTTRRFFLLGATSLLTATPALASFSFVTAGKALLKPPVARVAPVTDVYWGETISDPYRWMETNPPSDEWTTWLKGQGDYTRQALDALPAQKAVKAALETYAGAVPRVFIQATTAHHIFYRRREPDQASYVCWAKPRDGGPDVKLIDSNALSEAGKPRNVTDVLPSPDGRYFAYCIDQGGNEITETHILDLHTLADVTVCAIDSSMQTWLPDSSALIYSRIRPDAIPGDVTYNDGLSCWKHVPGSDPASDVKVFDWHEGFDAKGYKRDIPSLMMSAGSDFVLGMHRVNSNYAGLTFVARVSDLQPGKTPWKQVFSFDDKVRKAALVGGDIYLLTEGAHGRGEVIKVPAADPDVKNRTVVVPEGDNIMDSMDAARDGLYLHEIRGPVGGLKRYSYASGKIGDVALPHVGAVWEVFADPMSDGAFFGMDELTWLGALLQVHADLSVSDTGLMPKQPYDTTAFVTERVDVRARDGVTIPVDILRARKTVRNGKNPTLIQAYGAYGTVLDPGFVPGIMAFLALGGIFVYAHVRGGGEKGETWHQAGFKATKPNTWHDAIDVAEYLIAHKWTAPAHLALWGTSAGGVMVGRAVTERPELFAAAIGEVGLFDTLRFETTSNGPGNTEEFGTVTKADEYQALKAMSSYLHVRDGVKYPAMLFLTGANDNRVAPWIIGKMAARMQAATASHKPVLLRVDYESGHFASTQGNANAKSADMFAFVLTYTGLHPLV